MMGSVEGVELRIKKGRLWSEGVPKNLDILESCITCPCTSSTGILSFG